MCVCKCAHNKKNPLWRTYVVSHFVFQDIFFFFSLLTWYAPKNMLYKLFKLFTQVHNKEQEREKERRSIISLPLLRLAAILVFLPPSPICFSLHNLWRLIMFRQNDKRDTQTCGLAMISAAGCPSPDTHFTSSSPFSFFCFFGVPCDVCDAAKFVFICRVPLAAAAFLFYFRGRGKEGDY